MESILLLNEKNEIIIINVTAISFNVELYIWSESIVNRVPIHPESHKEKDTMWLLPMARYTISVNYLCSVS